VDKPVRGRYDGQDSIFSMNIISWNVNGLRAVLKKGTFLDFIKRHDPDILCLQETKALPHEAVIDLPEYTEYWNSADKKGYSGTAIFTKHPPIAVINNIPPDVVSEKTLVDSKGRNANTEGRVIAVEFATCFVVTVYTPNAKDTLERLSFRKKQWDPAFLRFMLQLEKKKPVIFCGDLNVAHEPIDLARPKPNEGKKGYTLEEREGFGNLVKAGFVDVFRARHPGEVGHYTWWTHWANARERNVGWRIDYVLTSKTLVKKVKKAFILPQVMGSDHCPVGIDITLPKK